MGNEVIIAVLVVIFFWAVRHSVKHFRGQGGCCGGGSTVKARKKKLRGQILGTYVFRIEGMHCENCKNRIEEKVNDIDGAACRVNWRKGTATVRFTRNITKEEIRDVIEKIGYTVVDMGSGEGSPVL